MDTVHIGYIGGSATDAAVLHALLDADKRITVSWHDDPATADADLLVLDASVEPQRLPHGVPIVSVDPDRAAPQRWVDAASALRCLLPGAWAAHRAARLQVELADTTARFDELFTRLADGIVIVNHDGVILLANPAAGLILGRDPQDLVGEPFGHPLVAGGWVELELVHPRARVVVAEMRAIAARWDDHPVVLVSLRDITGRKRAEEALRQSEERYALAAQGANDGLFDWRLDRNHVFYSGRWASMLQLQRHKLTTNISAWLDRVHPDDLAELRRQLDALRRGDERQLDCEYRIANGNGEYRWMRARGIVALDADGRPYRVCGSQSDVTDRIEAEQGLRHQALHDELTGLPNRTYFNERVDDAFVSTDRRDDGFAVLYVDFDRFKWVNDSLGHSAGDKLLQSAADRIVQCVRPGDVVARLGGDEFAIFLRGVTKRRDAAFVASRLQDSLSPPFVLEGTEFTCSASIGITLSGQGARNRNDVLREADLAMYRAKAAGGSRFVFFDEELSRQAVRRVSMERDIRRGLDHGEFTLHFQPVVSLEDGTVTGTEGLVRWDHPEQGLVMPGAFLPVADETGLFTPLGQRVLSVVCTQLEAWRDRPVTVAMNMSARQLCQPGVATDVQQAIQRMRIHADRLAIEVTEDALIANPDRAAETLTRLRGLGARIYADDFGTGFANLAYLTQFPVDGIKIDMSFVKGLPDDRVARAIVEATISLGRSLGLDVIAEGVERPEQAEFLALAGCPAAQGYLFGRPEPAASVDFSTRDLSPFLGRAALRRANERRPA